MEGGGGRMVRNGFIWLRTGSMADSCEHGNEFGYPIESGKFLDGLGGLLVTTEKGL
jgi:hypothetical protein